MNDRARVESSIHELNSVIHSSDLAICAILGVGASFSRIVFSKSFFLLFHITVQHLFEFSKDTSFILSDLHYPVTVNPIL